MKIPFFKVSATGNDFILIDNRELGLEEKHREFLGKMCQRRTSVGADGVLLIENGWGYDFQLRYINPNGSETECGNGARSAAFFAHRIGMTDTRPSFLFGQNIYEAVVSAGRVKLKLPEVRDLAESVGILEEGFLTEGGSVNTGVPHYVLFTEDIDEIDLMALGKKYRHHPKFAPEGTNVDFVEIVSDHEIRMRTYERGVEDETLSCGTGCVASAIFAHLKKGTRYPTQVQTKGGTLNVSEDSDKRFYLEGEVELIYEGKLNTSLDSPNN